MKQEAFNNLVDGLELVNRKMHEEEDKIAPMCHFRPMLKEQSDSIDGYYTEWWECSVCGHTKDIKERR